MCHTALGLARVHIAVPQDRMPWTSRSIMLLNRWIEGNSNTSDLQYSKHTSLVRNTSAAHKPFYSPPHLHARNALHSTPSKNSPSHGPNPTNTLVASIAFFASAAASLSNPKIFAYSARAPPPKRARSPASQISRPSHANPVAGIRGSR